MPDGRAQSPVAHRETTSHDGRDDQDGAVLSRIFNVRDIAHAKKIILTEEGPGAGTDDRWAIETRT